MWKVCRVLIVYVVAIVSLCCPNANSYTGAWNHRDDVNGDNSLYANPAAPVDSNPGPGDEPASARPGAEEVLRHDEGPPEPDVDKRPFGPRVIMARPPAAHHPAPPPSPPPSPSRHPADWSHHDEKRPFGGGVFSKAAAARISGSSSWRIRQRARRDVRRRRDEPDHGEWRREERKIPAAAAGLLRKYEDDYDPAIRSTAIDEPRRGERNPEEMERDFPPHPLEEEELDKLEASFGRARGLRRLSEVERKKHLIAAMLRLRSRHLQQQGSSGRWDDDEEEDEDEGRTHRDDLGPPDDEETKEEEVDSRRYPAAEFEDWTEMKAKRPFGSRSHRWKL